MSKQRLGLLILLCSMLVIVILALLIVKRNKELLRNEMLVRTIPKFCFQQTNGMDFTQDSLWQDFNYLFVFYKEHCDNCNYLKEDLCNNVDLLDNVLIMLVKSANQDSATRVCDSKPYNMLYLRAEGRELEKAFFVKGTPTLFLYNYDKNLLYHHNGEINVETIMSFLNNQNETKSY